MCVCVDGGGGREFAKMFPDIFKYFASCPQMLYQADLMQTLQTGETLRSSAAGAVCLTTVTHTQMHTLKLMSSQLRRPLSSIGWNKNTDSQHKLRAANKVGDLDVTVQLLPASA